MSPDRPGRFGPEAIARTTFQTSFRGYDQEHVRAFLDELALELRDQRDREAALRLQIDALQARVAGADPLDEAQLTAALGEEMTSVLTAARTAASDIRTKGEEAASQVIKDAHDQATKLRHEADSVLARRTEQANQEAAKIRAAVDEQAAALLAEVGAKARELEAAAAAALEKAKGDAARVADETAAAAEAELEAARGTGREMIQEAQAVRERVLRDLSRKRKAARVQLEQLRAGRDRLMQAHDVVRRTLDEATDELHVALSEAKLSADAAARRVEAEPEPPIEALEAEIAAARLAGFPLVAPERDDHDDHDITDEHARVDIAAAITGSESIDAPLVYEPRTSSAASPASPAAPPVDAELPPLPDEIPPAPEDLAPVAPPRAKKRRGVPDLPPVEYQPLTPRDPVEGMRVITGEVPVVTVLASADAVVETAAPDDATDAAEAPATSSKPTSGEDVDALFARLRSERAGEVAKAEAVLAVQPTPEPEPEVIVEEVVVVDDIVVVSDDGEVTEVMVVDIVEVVDGETVVEEVVVAITVSDDDDQALLERRDGLLEPIEAKLARRLKRALADEQNDALDKQRRSKGPATIEQLFAAVDEHAGRYAATAEELRAAADAGAVFAGGEPSEIDVDDLARELGLAIVAPLRERVTNALRDAGNDDEAAADGIRSCYREWKGQRIGALGADALHSAFNRGVMASLQPGTSLRWLVDDGGSPCPDAEDNALAGSVPCGDAFPTGHCQPPAHPGCRCMVVAVATTG